MCNVDDTEDAAEGEHAVVQQADVTVIGARGEQPWRIGVTWAVVGAESVMVDAGAIPMPDNMRRGRIEASSSDGEVVVPALRSRRGSGAIGAFALYGRKIPIDNRKISYRRERLCA